MLCYGLRYSDDCNNGATNFLVTGGAVVLTTNLIPAAFAMAVKLALCDNHINTAESMVLRTLLFIKDVLPLVGFVVTIWV